MNKSKKITFNMINELIPEAPEKEIVINEERGLVLTVKAMLGFDDAMNFARSVAASCFSSAEQFMPEVFDFSVAINVMMYYAGMDVPKDFGKAYRVLMQSDIYNRVLAEIDKDQLKALIGAAHQLVDHRREEIIQANIAKMSDLIGEVERMVKESNEAAEVINSGEFQKMMESFMANVGMNAAQNGSVNQKEKMATIDSGNIVPLNQGE